MIDSISRCSPRAWASLVRGRSFYSSLRWLLGAEEVIEAAVGAAVVERDGELVAAAPCWFTTGRENPMRTPQRVLQPVGLQGSSFLVVGNPTAYLSSLLLAEGMAAELVTPFLTSVLERTARERGANGCVVLYAPSDVAAAYRFARPALAPVLINAEAVIEVPESFDEYPPGVSSHRKTSIRKEWRAFHEAGYELRHEHLADCLEEFVPLYANLERKYGNPIDETELTRTLAIQANWCGDDDRVFTARREGCLVAASLCYVYERTMTVRMFAADYASLRGVYEYYGLTYYMPVRYAVENGYRRLWVGIESTEAKVARGATLRPLWALDLGETPLWGAEVARDQTNRRRADFADIVARLSRPDLWTCPEW